MLQVRATLLGESSREETLKLRGRSHRTRIYLCFRRHRTAPTTNPQLAATIAIESGVLWRESDEKTTKATTRSAALKRSITRWAKSAIGAGVAESFLVMISARRRPCRHVVRRC